VTEKLIERINMSGNRHDLLNHANATRMPRSRESIREIIWVYLLMSNKLFESEYLEENVPLLLLN
jgi:hypothetical protein